MSRQEVMRGALRSYHASPNFPPLELRSLGPTAGRGSVTANCWTPWTTSLCGKNPVRTLLRNIIALLGADVEESLPCIVDVISKAPDA
jgi:hypothetical protein